MWTRLHPHCISIDFNRKPRKNCSQTEDTVLSKRLCSDHLSLVVIYIFTPSCGFNVSQLVILDCVSARMFTKNVFFITSMTKKTLHILGT